MTTPARCLAIAEAAAYLGVGERWLADKVTARLVPHHRFGKHVRFTPADMRAIEADAAEPTVADHARELRSA
jgi:excisionase family DNA binding protein